MVLRGSNRGATKKGGSKLPSFHTSVKSANHPSVAGSFCAGLVAMGGYSTKVKCADPRKLRGSIDIDSALQGDPAFAQLNRWDYGFGYQSAANQPEIAVWVEVHSAHTSEVSVVIRKKNWLKNYLIAECADLWKMTSLNQRSLGQFYWIASKGVQISKNSPQARLLASSGISWPQSILVLD